MVDQIVDYYKRELGPYNLVFKNFKFPWPIFKLSVWGLVPCITFLIGKLAFKQFNYIDILAAIPIILFGLLLFILNSKSKHVLKQKYGIVSKGRIWRDYQFENLQVQLLGKYLQKNNMKSEKKVQHILCLINKCADEKKYKSFIWPGVGLAFLVPLWSQFISWLYKQIKTLQDFLYISVFLFIGILFMLFVVGMIISICKEVVDDVANAEANKLKVIARLLDNILISLMKD